MEMISLVADNKASLEALEIRVSVVHAAYLEIAEWFTWLDEFLTCRVSEKQRGQRQRDATVDT